jgi:PAS domain S-box-containing protein
LSDAGAVVRGEDWPLPPRELLRVVIDMSDDAVVVCDCDGRVVSWGSTAERLFGRRESEALGVDFEELFGRHLRPGVRAVVSAAMAGDRIRHFESELVRSDGMPLPVSLSLCPVVESERAIACVVLAKDITEQRIAQAALAEMDARLVESEAVSHTGSWLWDLRTDVVQWSAEMHRIFDVDPLDFDGTLESQLQHVYADDRADLWAAMERSVESGRPFECDCRVRRGAGGSAVVRVQGQPTIGSDGKVVGLRGYGRQLVGREDDPPTRAPRGA